MEHCMDCGNEYPFGLDMALPDQQWKFICPTDGLLCANCISQRAEKLGSATVIMAWIDRVDYSVERPKEWFKETER